jgi:hypothetical protein
MNSLILISPSLVRGFQPIISGKITLLSSVRGGGHRLYSSGFNRRLIFSR